MNMEIIGPLILALISGFSTMVGIIPIYFKVKRVEELISFSLSLSYFILLSISIFDLLPSSLPVVIKGYGLFKGILISLFFFLLGYLIIYFMKSKKEDSSLHKIGIISMISLILHNIPEGIIVFMSSFKSIRIGIKTFIAIVFHNVPEGLLISIPLYYSKESRGNVIKKVFIASISEPLGALLSYLFLSRLINDYIISYMLLFVAGLMISLCFNEIYKELLKYNKRYIFYGFIASMIFLSFLLML